VQTTLLAFAIALILALLAALVGPHFVDWNDHRAFFEAEASRLVGTKVRVGGNIEAAILPVPSVTLQDIVIGPATGDSRLRAASLRMDLGLGALMRGEIRATDMRLVAPQFGIGLDREGRIDWPPLALSTDTLSIDKLAIENGRATLTDAASGSRLVLDQFWFAGEVRALTGPFRGKGEFVSDGRLYGYDVVAGRQGPDGMRIKLALRNDERPLTVEADGMLAFERAAPRFDGALTLSRPAGAVLASGKARAYEPWRLTGKVKADAAAAVLDDVAFQYGPDERAVSLTGSAKLVFGAQARLEGKLAARQIDFDRMLATPEAAQRLPIPAVRAFGELLGGALRPSWPVALSVSVDGATLGGANVQGIAAELRSDGAAWALDRLELRAPGLSQIKLSGRLYAVGKGLGFAGGASVESNDPKALVAWLTAAAPGTAPIKPWRVKGDVTLAPDRIAVERLNAAFERGAVAGSLAYAWPAGDRPARLNADLRAAELDLDALFATGRPALAGLGFEVPREFTLALDIGHGRLGGFEARDVKARLTLDAGGLAIERLAIGDFGGARIDANGRVRTEAAPGGNIRVDVNAKDIAGLVALAEKFIPPLSSPLRRIAGRERTAALRLLVGMGASGADGAFGMLGLSGRVGAVRLDVSARASGRREMFALTGLLTSLDALTGADVSFDGRLESDDAGVLLALVGLDRVATSGNRPARLALTANGPLAGDLKLEGKLAAGPIDAVGKGVLRRAPGQPVTLDLDQVSGTVGGGKVQGRLAFKFGETPRVDGSLEAESLDAPATIAAAIGMPMRTDANAGGWSSEPFAWGTSALTGRIAFKAPRAVLAPSMVARQVQGVARFGQSELVFENVAGELANGHLEGRLAFEHGADGLSARLNVALTGADAGAIFVADGGPAVSGRLTLQTELESAGRSPAAFIGSLSGFGTVKLENAELAGLNPEVFGAVSRAVELGIPVDGNRIREFVGGVLGNARLPVSQATAAISVSAGRASFKDVAISAAGAELKADASLDLADGTLDAALVLTGSPAAPGAPRPAVPVTLRGPVLSPGRTVDTDPLTSWLTLRAVEQHSRQLDAMERGGRGTHPASRPAAPPLPPPVEVPAQRKPPSAPRTQGALRPSGLVGAQN